MANIEVGMKAPSFVGKGVKGEEICLEDHLGKNIILYFYPKDMTPGCTTQACDFRDHYEAFGNLNTIIIGISPDPIEKHEKFIEKYGLPFLLVSDENKEIAEQYGVYKEKKMYGKTYMGIERTTFVIDTEGNINKIFPKVKVKDHIIKVLEYIKENL